MSLALPGDTVRAIADCGLIKDKLGWQPRHDDLPTVIDTALGGRERYQRNGPPKGYRNGHRHRQLVGTFGALTVSLPRVRLSTGMAVRRNGGARPSRSTSG